jgi:hypothetical protein
MAETAAMPRLAMAVLVPEADGGESPTARSAAGVSASPGKTSIVDPVYGLVAMAPVTVDWTPESPVAEPVAVDIPWREPDDLYELLETLYVLRAWKGVDAIVGSVERSLVAEVFRLHPLPGLPRAAPVPAVRASMAIHYLAVPTDADFAIAAATAAVDATDHTPRVAAALRQIRQTMDVFSQDLPRARIRGAEHIDPRSAARLFADVLLALVDARADLAARVRGALRRVELETGRLISTMLTDARAEIVRETGRYFTLTGTGIEAALDRLLDRPVATLGQAASGAEKPLAKDPEDLRKALRELVPFAWVVVKFDRSARGTATTAKMVEAALASARAILAKEVGRRGQAFPVLAHIDPKGILEAAESDSKRLGRVVFPVLARALKANKAMRGRASRFVGMAQVAPAAPYPELALAKVVLGEGLETSSWGYRKYVEKAAGRVVGATDQVARRAVQEVNAALGVTDAKAVGALAQAAGEMLALGGAAHFASKLVPVVNIATAAWHITVAVEVYQDRHDEFYCTLDPRDALVDVAPSAAGLVLDIATEAAFAFI